MITNNRESPVTLEPTDIANLAPGVHTIVLPRLVGIAPLPSHIVSEYSYEEVPLAAHVIGQIIESYVRAALESGCSYSLLTVLAAVEMPKRADVHPSRTNQEQRIYMTINKPSVEIKRPGRQTTYG